MDNDTGYADLCDLLGDYCSLILFFSFSCKTTAFFSNSMTVGVLLDAPWHIFIAIYHSPGFYGTHWKFTSVMEKKGGGVMGRLLDQFCSIQSHQEGVIVHVVFSD